MGARFTYTVETMHLDNDAGSEENASFSPSAIPFYCNNSLQILKMSKSELKQRVVKHIDIVDPVPESEDPTKFKSEKTNRGPLQKGWEVRNYK